MTGFDHLAFGTSEQEWQDAALLSGLASISPPGDGCRVVVLAAHPDDETLGAGGLMALCSRAGVHVVVVVATDGEASHPHSPTTTPDALAQRRRAEVTAAVRVLAPDADLHFLGLGDGQLDEDREELQRRLTPLADDATHVISPWRSDRHPDHEACAAVAEDVARTIGAAQWQYPIWAWHWDDPKDPALASYGLHRIALTEADLARKRQALACHRSQHAALSTAPGDEAILPPRIVAHFLRDFETFVVEPADASSPRFFDDLYAHSDDPWDLEHRFYERRKRDLVLASLPRRRFGRAFEPGCSTGLLTAMLAQRCDEVIAWDVSVRALELAAARTSSSAGVRLDRRQIPGDWPDAPLDLVVLSEVGYYCPELDRLAERVVNTLADDGVVLACHWRHPAPDHPHSAEAVHSALDSRLSTVVSHIEPDFLLQVWSRTGRSVAQDDGIVR